MDLQLPRPRKSQPTTDFIFSAFYFYSFKSSKGNNISNIKTGEKTYKENITSGGGPEPKNAST